jgi:hypothetical protein
MALTSAGSSPSFGPVRPCSALFGPVRPCSALFGPSEARGFPIGGPPFAILRRPQAGRLFVKAGRLGEAQACRFDPSLRTHQVRLFSRLIDRHVGGDPGRAFRPHQIARLLHFSACPVVIGCALQGGGGVTECVHLRVGSRQGADLRQQTHMLPRDPSKAIGRLRIVDRLFVQNFEEPSDGFDRDAAVGWDDLVQPDIQ